MKWPTSLFEVGHTYPWRTENKQSKIVHRFEDGRYVCVSRAKVSGAEYAYIVSENGRSLDGFGSLSAPDLTEAFFV